jgi:hypothetical protein
MPRTATFREFRANQTAEQVAGYQQALRERLKLDLDLMPLKLLDSSEVAKLAGVMPGTITQWKRRTRLRQTQTPFLSPAPESYPEKDLYDPLAVCFWLDWADKWPPERAAREDTRGPKADRVTA